MAAPSPDDAQRLQDNRAAVERAAQQSERITAVVRQSRRMRRRVEPRLRRAGLLR